MNQILLMSMLFEPVGTPILDELTEADCKVIQAYCLAEQYMDPREVPYLMLVGNAEEDLDVLRKRVADLRNVPKLGYDPWPDRDWVKDCMALNQRYTNYLNSRLIVDADMAPQIQQVLKENSRLWEVYDALYDVKCEYYYNTTRRYALARLQKELGEAYYMGMLPPPVPIWRFTDQ